MRRRTGEAPAQGSLVDRAADRATRRSAGSAREQPRQPANAEHAGRERSESLVDIPMPSPNDHPTGVLTANQLAILRMLPANDYVHLDLDFSRTLPPRYRTVVDGDTRAEGKNAPVSTARGISTHNTFGGAQPRFPDGSPTWQVGVPLDAARADRLVSPRAPATRF